MKFIPWKIVLVRLLLLLTLFDRLQCQEPSSGYALSVATDHPDAIYQQGENVIFTVHLMHDHEMASDLGEVKWILTKDGMPPVQKGTLTLQNGVGTIIGKLDEPGFLQCKVTFKEGNEIIMGLAGAGIDPTLIKPSLPVPDDFDAFWKAEKTKLAQVPINPQLTPIPSGATGVEVFDLQADCIGAPVSGYFARPTGAKLGSRPAILLLEAAGVYSPDTKNVIKWAKAGALALEINAHGIPNGKPADFYKQLASGELADYRTRGRVSRDKVYFHGMDLRVQRALDFLTSQPDWDGKTLIASGTSQGGGQAIAAAGLDARVSFVAAVVPALCDHTGAVVGRISGWPKIVPVGTDGKPDPDVLNAVRYVDGVNFATRIKCPAFFATGFIDSVAPPSTVYAAYNSLQGKKEIYNDITGGHNGDPKIRDLVDQAIQNHLSAQSNR